MNTHWQLGWSAVIVEMLEEQDSLNRKEERDTDSSSIFFSAQPMSRPFLIRTSVKHLYGHKLRAADGEVGHVKDFYFDEQSWVMRYLVADSGFWLRSVRQFDGAKQTNHQTKREDVVC